MDYAYKPTTHGRAVMAACMALERTFHITRVAFGSGLVDEETNLADVHELLEYVSDGAVAERRHESDRFYLTIQFANQQHQEIKTFLLTEFIVYVEDPVTGTETDLLYGTLGDYRQPVPGYNPAFPPSVFNFPLELILSDEIHVDISAPAGLVTYRELMEVIDALGTKALALTIPADGWEKDPAGGLYQYFVDIPAAGVTAKMIPNISILPDGAGSAQECGLCPSCLSQDGALRVWTKVIPGGPIPATVTLFGDASSYVTVRDESSAHIPPATEHTVGGVKVGEGLNVTSDGTLSVSTASDAEVNEVLDGALAPNDK